MNILVEKLAEFLEITIEQATRLYPILKQQFVWYKILNKPNTIADIACGLSVATLIIGCFYFFLAVDDYSTEKERKTAKRAIKVPLIILIVGLVIIFTINTATLLLAPDLMLLKEFLIK